jgi:hypothetical protein
MALVVHMPAPLLCDHASLRAEGVRISVGPDVEHAPGIPTSLTKL